MFFLITFRKRNPFLRRQKKEDVLQAVLGQTWRHFTNDSQSERNVNWRTDWIGDRKFGTGSLSTYEKWGWTPMLFLSFMIAMTSQTETWDLRVGTYFCESIPDWSHRTEAWKLPPKKKALFGVIEQQLWILLFTFCPMTLFVNLLQTY